MTKYKRQLAATPYSTKLCSEYSPLLLVFQYSFHAMDNSDACERQRKSQTATKKEIESEGEGEEKKTGKKSWDAHSKQLKHHKLDFEGVA